MPKKKLVTKFQPGQAPKHYVACDASIRSFLLANGFTKSESSTESIVWYNNHNTFISVEEIDGLPTLS